MTSKKQLRAEIDALRHAMREAAFDCTCYVKSEIAPIVVRDWAEHMARVADAAREEGNAAGWRAGITIGTLDAIANGQTITYGADAMADARAVLAFLSPPQPQPVPEAAPEPAKPSAGKANRFSGDFDCCDYECNCQPDCGFACHCTQPMPQGWTQGSTTR